MAYQVRVRGLNRAAVQRYGYDSSVVKIDDSADLVDLDDGNTRKVLQGQRNRWVVLPDLMATLQLAGNVATATTASGLVWRAPRACKLERVIAQVGTAPVTTSILIDVHRVAAGGEATAAGTTVFTTQGRRPEIAATETVSDATSATVGVPQVTDLAAGDLLRVELDQVGTGTTGADLVVQIFAY